MRPIVRGARCSSTPRYSTAPLLRLNDSTGGRRVRSRAPVRCAQTLTPTWHRRGVGAPPRHRRLLTRRARSTSGTATQSRQGKHSPPPPPSPSPSPASSSFARLWVSTGVNATQRGPRPLTGAGKTASTAWRVIDTHAYESDRSRAQASVVRRRCRCPQSGPSDHSLTVPSSQPAPRNTEPAGPTKASDVTCHRRITATPGRACTRGPPH
jgi:hypothetical protein